MKILRRLLRIQNFLQCIKKNLKKKMYKERSEIKWMMMCTVDNITKKNYFKNYLLTLIEFPNQSHFLKFSPMDLPEQLYLTRFLTDLTPFNCACLIKFICISLSSCVIYICQSVECVRSTPSRVSLLVFHLFPIPLYFNVR